MRNKKQLINVAVILFSFCFISCINKKPQTAEFENAEKIIRILKKLNTIRKTMSFKTMRQIIFRGNIFFPQVSLWNTKILI